MRLSGKIIWISSPLLRLHCDTNLNQSVPKRNEKCLTLLLQPFTMHCPGFAKSFVLGVWSHASLEHVWGCAPSRSPRVAHIHTLGLGMSSPCCTHILPAVCSICERSWDAVKPTQDTKGLRGRNSWTQLALTPMSAGWDVPILSRVPTQRA